MTPLSSCNVTAVQIYRLRTMLCYYIRLTAMYYRMICFFPLSMTGSVISPSQTVTHPNLLPHPPAWHILSSTLQECDGLGCSQGFIWQAKAQKAADRQEHGTDGRNEFSGW